MRGRLTAGTMLVALLTNLALAGCGAKLPAAVDGELTDDWAKVAQVKGYEPQVGACYGAAPKDTGGRFDSVVDCKPSHYGETVHVGRFGGDDKPGPKERAAAFRDCDKQANAYIGRPWADGKFYLTLTVPTDRAWDGGARWYRCDVTESTTVFGDDRWATRVGTLKDGITADALLRCGKAVLKSGRIQSVVNVPCTVAHNAEYVGMFRAGDLVAYPKSERQWDVLHRECRKVVGTYLGSQSAAGRFGLISWPMGPENWSDGDRTVRCLIWFESKTTKKSAKGSKGRGLPGY